MNDQGQRAWETFVQRIETNKNLRGFKKRNYLLVNADEVAEKFRTRNLNDTRYATRILAEAARVFYPHGERQEKGGKRRVYTRPGALTAALRKAWGIESLKKKIDGERLSDDRHHALDALVVAAVSEAEIQRLTRSFQMWEQRGLARPLRKVDEPWKGFRNHVKAALEAVFVARSERRRARGEGHAATIRQLRERNGQCKVFRRIDVQQLGLSQLKDLKDLERNQAVARAIKNWIDAGRPSDPDKQPRSPRGDIITRVKLVTKGKPAVIVRGGTADRGDMVRVDVFTRPTKKGKDQWYLVPVYPHQVMNKKDWPHPPMRAVAGKGEQDWEKMKPDEFRFSLYPRSYVEVKKPDGEVIEGYFRGLNRSTGAIDLASRNDPTSVCKGIGARTLLFINKYHVDRFGRKSPVRKEVRTWHGEACTFPSPPG